MRIGFANIYSWRPHGEHLFYLSRLVEEAGHQTSFLTCDSSVATCYAREIKGTSRLTECPPCIAGGVRSFPLSGVTSISTKSGSLNIEELDKIALSSSCTLARVEAEQEWGEPSVKAIRERLYGSIDQTYTSARRWIDAERIDAVICFNGRMDLTKAVTLACEHAGIPFITHERPWFSHGLHLTPNENCLSLKAIQHMVNDYSEKPLTLDHAAFAAKIAADRFLQRGNLEWRLYNKEPENTHWPTQTSGPRVLVLPSSKNEFAGHPEWNSGWSSNTEALDDFMSQFSIAPEQVVVRCHPNWAESIGQVGGSRSLTHYKKWCEKHAIHCVLSEEKQSTYDLIRQADVVVMNGGSSVVEAGVCGKQIFCLGPSRYATAGFVHTIATPDHLSDPKFKVEMDPTTIVQRTLRYVVVSALRHPQYVSYVRAIATTRYRYFEGADPDRLVSMFQTGLLAADNSVVAQSDSAEREVVQMLLAGEWEPLSSYIQEPITGRPKDIGRRPSLRWMEGFRSQFSRGDLGR